MSTVRFLFNAKPTELEVRGILHAVPACSMTATVPEASLDDDAASRFHDFHVCDLQALYADVVDLLDRRPLGVFHRQLVRTLALESSVFEVAQALEASDRMALLRFVFVYCLCRDQVYFSALLRQSIAGSHSLFDFVEANFHKPWPVGRLADEFGMPLRKFRYLFQQTYGMPAKQWLLERRLRLARDLLLSTRHKVLDIALECGFTNHAHFTDTFRKRFDCAPTEIRLGAPPLRGGMRVALPTADAFALMRADLVAGHGAHDKEMAL
ncbi:Virulence regulon transcriptional activator VirF [Pandoraea terrae]|uniref:Virulence regulon transcriptional activator VirF n=1 Tax=Pandoraea terrae TaxID=1537710 RepID=A0A5E4ZD56_9BURK|nr:AraC family transcriptional regulator [Pandoraea terrae]VVE59219.1 Virulence regulon transcriptional activator VirF [Pandoraea terrae]